jgi:AraC-like DNA-binding protein
MDPMTYRAFEPCPQLRPFVRRLLVANEAGLAEQSMWPAPTGYNYLAWVYDGELFVSIDQHIARAFRGLVFFGQITTHRVEIRCPGRVAHILAEFTATGLYRLTHIAGRNVVGLMVQVGDVAPALAARMSHTLAVSRRHAAASPLQAFEHALLSCLDEALPAIDYLEHAAEMIESIDGAVRIADVCRSLGISQRQLARRFTEVVGVGPKAFARILQVNAALVALLNIGETSLTELSHACGYYDQAHLIGAMRRSFGRSPGQLLASNPVLLAEFLGTSRRFSRSAPLRTTD